MQQLALTDAFPDERPVLGNCQHCGQPVREGDAHKASAALDFDPIGQVYVSKVRYWHISKLSEDPDREARLQSPGLEGGHGENPG